MFSIYKKIPQTANDDGIFPENKIFWGIKFVENYTNQESDQQVIKLLKEWGYKIYRLLCTEYQEDCIVLHPEHHIDEIKFIENQKQIGFTILT